MDIILDPASELNSSEREGTEGSLTLLEQAPGLALPYIIILGVIAVIGTFGNFMIVGTLACGGSGRGSGGCWGCFGGAGVGGGPGGVGGYAVGNLFITNLACSDFIVTALVNPFAIIGVTHGYDIYTGRQWLCKTLASLCVTSCVVSLLTVGCISVNRYVFVCHQTLYRHVYTPLHSRAIVLAIWLIGVGMDLPSHLGWSRHEYDHKSHKCLWSRTHAHSYTVFFVSVGMLVPLAIITCCYALIFRHIRAAKQRLERIQTSRRAGPSPILKTIRQVRSMFIIFAAFAICWAPYIAVLLADSSDSFPMSVHLYASLVAHLHASVNFAIYGLTNNLIRAGYRQFVRQGLCCSPGGSNSPHGGFPTSSVTASLLLSKGETGGRGGRGEGARGGRKFSEEENSSGGRFIAVAFTRRGGAGAGVAQSQSIALGRLRHGCGIQGDEKVKEKGLLRPGGQNGAQQDGDKFEGSEGGENGQSLKGSDEMLRKGPEGMEQDFGNGNNDLKSCGAPRGPSGVEDPGIWLGVEVVARYPDVKLGDLCCIDPLNVMDVSAKGTKGSGKIDAVEVIVGLEEEFSRPLVMKERREFEVGVDASSKIESYGSMNEAPAERELSACELEAENSEVYERL